MNEYEILSKLLFDKYGKVALTENETSFVVGSVIKFYRKIERKQEVYHF